MCKTLSLWTRIATVAWSSHPIGWLPSRSSSVEVASDSPGGVSETEKPERFVPVQALSKKREAEATCSLLTDSSKFPHTSGIIKISQYSS